MPASFRNFAQFSSPARSSSSFFRSSALKSSTSFFASSVVASTVFFCASLNLSNPSFNLFRASATVGARSVPFSGSAGFSHLGFEIGEDAENLHQALDGLPLPRHGLRGGGAWRGGGIGRGGGGLERLRGGGEFVRVEAAQNRADAFRDRIFERRKQSRRVQDAVPDFRLRGGQRGRLRRRNPSPRTAASRSKREPPSVSLGVRPARDKPVRGIFVDSRAIFVESTSVTENSAERAMRSPSVPESDAST